ncbi:MAG: peptide chain release factor 1 [Verrucomicrobia bacterium]|nr:peptide chain release factor 1 [Verrucomicrobiota bacterium]
MQARISKLLRRFQEVEDLLGQPEILADQTKYRALTQEHAYLSQVKETHGAIERIEQQIAGDLELLKTEADPELVTLLKEEVATLQGALTRNTRQLETLLVPPDPRDSRNVIMELRAGTGGDEAAIFVGDCVRMYKCYADKKGWRYEMLSCATSERGGFKEYVMVIAGHNVFRLLQHEAGTHRVQRVPETEAQGRIHTSAITVAILPEPGEEEKVVLDERDLKIDTYRSSGAGGQHVNVTDSAVRITHLPTGVVVACQEERSQHKNKEKAMRILVAKIAEEKQRRAHAEMSELRSTQVGSGDRSERIRTYNFPQNRVTDHRIEVTLYKLNLVMDGDLDDLTEPLVAFFYQQQLAGHEDDR